MYAAYQYMQGAMASTINRNSCDEQNMGGLFLKICGKIIWPSSLTRPDMAHFVGTLTQLTMDRCHPQLDRTYSCILYTKVVSSGSGLSEPMW